MEREEDYDLQKKGVKIETPEGEAGASMDTAKEDLISRETRAFSDSRRESRKSGFTGYLHFIWPYAFIVTCVFIGSFVAGYISVESFPDMADTLMESFSSRFAPLLEKGPLEIMLAIFLNNAFVSLIALVLGLALGIIPMIIIAFNGYLVGLVANLVAQQKGLLYISLALVPHGILELPMVFLSAGIGLRLGHQVFAALLGRPTDIKSEFKEGLTFYFRWIVPLLFLAAVIETFITPLILSLVS